MHKDAAFLNERDAQWENCKRQRKGLPPVAPLYTVEDADAAMKRFCAVDYGRRRRIAPGVSFRRLDAGHILGSAIVELWLTEGAVERKLVFSGDLGHRGAPILRDVTAVAEADLVLLESTHGDRLHRSLDDTLAELGQILGAAAADRGNILIPAFAVGRSQKLLYLFGLWRDNCHVIISGFQAAGTLGRRLVEGARFVKLWGEAVRVAAQVHTVGGLSAHAGRDGLLDWYGGFAAAPPVVLVHGEPRALDALAGALHARGAARVQCAAPGARVDLAQAPPVSRQRAGARSRRSTPAPGR